MSFSKDTAVEKAKKDLAARLNIAENGIETVSVSDTEFSDMSLGAPVEDEMSAQMIASGWQIDLRADGKQYNYRADKYQVRLHDYDGKNYIIES